MAYTNFNARLYEIEEASGSCKIQAAKCEDGGYPELVPYLKGAALALDLLVRLEKLETMGVALSAALIESGVE